MDTKKRKIIDKSYLTEQLYKFNKKFIQEGVQLSKQDKLVVNDGLLSLAKGTELKFNIKNKDAKVNGAYLVWKEEDGALNWKTPAVLNNLESSDSFVTGEVLYNFSGSNNISEVGTISSGSWDVGNVKINENGIAIGNYVIEYDSENGYLNFSNSEEDEEEFKYYFSTDVKATNVAVNNLAPEKIIGEVNFSEANIVLNSGNFFKINNTKYAIREEGVTKNEVAGWLTQS